MSIASSSGPVTGPVTSQSSSRNSIIAAVAIVLVCAGGFAAFVYNRSRPTPAVAVIRDIVDYTVVSGQVIAPPYAIADARAPYVAAVNRVETSIGSNVRKGDVLIEMANPSSTEDYSQAKANLASLESTYSSMKSEYDAGVKAARAQLTAAQDGTASGASSNNNTSSNTTTSDENTQTSSVQNNSTNSSVQIAPAPMSVADAQQALDQARADRDAGLASYQTQLDDARSAYTALRAGRSMSRIVAPISGTVVTLNAQPGQPTGSTAAPVATIIKLDDLQVEAPLSANQVAFIHPDMRAKLSVAGINGRQFDAKVRRIVSQPTVSSSGAVTGTRYVALLSFSNDGGLVRPQTAATLNFKIGEVKDAVAVPVRAVSVDGTGKPTVRVLQNGQWQPTVVQTGLTDGQFIEVRNGLQAGETVQVKHSPFGQSTVK